MMWETLGNDHWKDWKWDCRMILKWLN